MARTLTKTSLQEETLYIFNIVKEDKVDFETSFLRCLHIINAGFF